MSEMVYMPALGASANPKVTGNAKADGLRAARVIELEYSRGKKGFGFLKKADMDEIVNGDGFNGPATRLTLKENMEGFVSGFGTMVQDFVSAVDELAMFTIARNIGLICVLPGLWLQCRVMERQVEAERAHSSCMTLVESNQKDADQNSYLQAAGVKIKFVWEGPPLFGRGAGEYASTRTPKLIIEFTKPKA